MNVLIISHAAGTPEIGPNMRTYYLGKNLCEAGHIVDIIGSGNFHKYSHSPLINSEYTKKVVDGINYHWLPTYEYKKRNHHQVINQLDFIFQGLKRKALWMNLNPDIIIASSPHPFCIILAQTIAKKCASKLIFELRDMWPEIIIELGKFNSLHPYIVMLNKTVKHAYKISDAIVSVKEGDLKYISENYTTKGNLKFIPNGFDMNNIQDEEYIHPVFDSNSFKVVYTGALSSYYSIDSLIKVASFVSKGFRDIEFIIVGDGEDRERLEKMSKDFGLNNCHYLGHLPKKNMLSIIKKCDVAYLGLKDTQANRKGISTNKLFEYLYTKKPILASYNTDFDLVKESNCGISVPSESPHLISEALISIYKCTKWEREEMGLRGYNYLLKNHTFEVITQKYKTLFKTLLDE